jgi:hypothetical protein
MARVLFLILKLQETEKLKVGVLKNMNLGTPLVVSIEFRTARPSQTIVTGSCITYRQQLWSMTLMYFSKPDPPKVFNGNINTPVLISNILHILHITNYIFFPVIKIYKIWHSFDVHLHRTSTFSYELKFPLLYEERHKEIEMKSPCLQDICSHRFRITIVKHESTRSESLVSFTCIFRRKSVEYSHVLKDDLV